LIMKLGPANTTSSNKINMLWVMKAVPIFLRLYLRFTKVTQ